MKNDSKEHRKRLFETKRRAQEDIDKTIEYRKRLFEAKRRAQEDIDKTIITLSSGALGISFAFINTFVAHKQIQYKEILLSAWIFWIISITSIVVSYYTSKLAHQKTIKQIDLDPNTKEYLGGWYNRFTKFLNFFSGLLFIIGLIAMMLFASYNI